LPAAAVDFSSFVARPHWRGNVGVDGVELGAVKGGGSLVWLSQMIRAREGAWETSTFRCHGEVEWYTKVRSLRSRAWRGRLRVTKKITWHKEITRQASFW